jgi:hypothetical protein
LNKKFKNIWDAQYKFEKKFFEHKGLVLNNLSLGDKRHWTKEFFNHIIIELSESLNNIQYKMHRKQTDEVNEYNIKENIVDAFKLVMGMAQIWFKDDDEFVKLFYDKTEIVDFRFEFEKIKNISKTNKPVVIVDIDGVLENLEDSMADQCKNFNPHYGDYYSTREIKNKFPTEYEKIKHEFRISDGHRHLDTCKGSCSFMKKLKDLGFAIVIITARPYERYNNLWADTKYWLDEWGFEYDALYFDNKKHEKILNEFDDINNIKYIIDDALDVCQNVEKLGIKVFNIDHQHITFDYILNSIENDIKNNYKNL